MITVAILAGLVTGILSGLLGIGGGAILVAAAVLAMGIPQHAAQAAALAATIPTAVVGVIRHHRNRLINYNMAPYLAVGILLGGFVGAYVANMLPETALRKIFSAFFAVMSIQMFWSSYKTAPKEKVNQSEQSGQLSGE